MYQLDNMAMGMQLHILGKEMQTLWMHCVYQLVLWYDIELQIGQATNLGFYNSITLQIYKSTIAYQQRNATQFIDHLSGHHCEESLVKKKPCQKSLGNEKKRIKVNDIYSGAFSKNYYVENSFFASPWEGYL